MALIIKTNLITKARYYQCPICGSEMSMKDHKFTGSSEIATTIFSCPGCTYVLPDIEALATVSIPKSIFNKIFFSDIVFNKTFALNLRPQITKFYNLQNERQVIAVKHHLEEDDYLTTKQY